MGGKRRRDPSEYNPKERNKVGAYYANKKKKAGNRNDEPRPGTSRDEEDQEERERHEYDLGSDFSENEDVDFEEEAQELQIGQMGRAGRGGAGGGTNGNLGVQEGGDKPWGMTSKKHTRTYTKTYTIYFNGGTTNLNIVQNDGTTTSPASVQWNEGWQIIPWGFLAASMTPGEWIELSFKCRKYRIKHTSVLIENMIPFQEVATATGETQTIATASNRPAIWLFKDSYKHKILPKLADNIGMAQLAHSSNFQQPYNNYTTGALKSPTFLLNNTQLLNQTYRLKAALVAGIPQEWFSLLSTGRVKTLQAGAKIHESWTNKSKTWTEMRLNWDIQQNLTFSAGATADAYMLNKSASLTGNFNQHVGSKTDGQGYQFGAVSGATTRLNHYADTNLGLQEGGPPYLLIKVEPYHDTADNALNIYYKGTIHYSTTIEWEDNERFNTVAPYQFNLAVATTDLATFVTNSTNALGTFATGNEIDAKYGPNPENVVYI